MCRSFLNILIAVLILAGCDLNLAFALVDDDLVASPAAVQESGGFPKVSLGAEGCLFRQNIPQCSSMNIQLQEKMLCTKWSLQYFSMANAKLRHKLHLKLEIVVCVA